MFCKKCGKEMNDDAEFCPFCGAECISREVPVHTTGTGGEVARKAKGFLTNVKERLHLHSIFDDSISRTDGEKRLSSGYFILAICTLLLIIFSFTKGLTLGIPELELFNDIKLDKFSISFGDVHSICTVLESVFGEVKDIADIPSEVMLALAALNFLYSVAFLFICAAPAVAIFSLLQRSVTNKAWLICERIFLISSFVVYAIYFILLKVGAMVISSETSTDITVQLNFRGIVFLVIYIVAFILLGTISRRLSKEYQQRWRERLELQRAQEQGASQQ